MKKKRAIRLTTEDYVMNALTSAVVILCFIVTLYPLWYCLVYALNDGIDAIKGGLYFWPRVFSLENFQTVVKNQNILNAYAMTVARTVAGTVLSLAVMMAGSYALTKKDLMFRKFYTALFIISMYFGGGIVPYYLLLRDLHLLNTFWVYILPGLAGYFNMLLIMAFIRQLPSALEDSAMIDGAGPARIFLQIIVPLSKPIIATVAMFVAVGHWNDWFSTAYYTNSPRLMTISTYLTKLIQEEVAKASVASRMENSVSKQMLATQSLKYAALIITILPIITIYPFAQKFFVKGMMVGSVKA